MRISVTRNQSLPKLAWYCHIERGNEQISLECGEAVETGLDFFVEGAWAGTFSDAEILDSPFFGTGGKLTGEGITFSPPDHILDRLFLIINADALSISNSLAFVLARTRRTLDPTRHDYPWMFAQIRNGLDHYRTPLPLLGGGEVEIWSWFHCHVGRDMRITKVDKKRRADFSSFSAYEGHLKSVIGAVFENAHDQARRIRFTPLATMSSGYDSTAIAALASDCGCDRPITFGKSRAKFGRPAEDDSGAEAAKALNINLHYIDRLSYRSMPGFPELDGLGAATELSSARPLLKNSVLLVGYMGDTMWDRLPKTISTNITWPLIAGHNTVELRLETGMVHFPVPFIGCRQHPEIVAISQSKEMAPWTLYSPYDRPICRRICEERGVPRDSFGNKKLAAGVFFREEGLEQTMTPQSYADYHSFRAQHSRTSLLHAKFFDRVASVTSTANSALNRATTIVNRATNLKKKPFALSYNAGVRSEGALLFPWAVDRLRERYGFTN